MSLSLRLELSRGAMLHWGNHPQGLRSGTRCCTGSPDGGPRQSSRERSTLRQNEGTACGLRSMPRHALLGLMFEVSIGTCVIRTSTMKS